VFLNIVDLIVRYGFFFFCFVVCGPFAGVGQLKWSTIFISWNAMHTVPSIQSHTSAIAIFHGEEWDAGRYVQGAACTMNKRAHALAISDFRVIVVNKLM
jgi:hypothetical protein